MSRDQLLAMAGLGALTLLSACADLQTVLPDVDAYGMPSAELALQRSMERVDGAMRSLGGLDVGRRAASTAPVVVPAELNRPSSLTWSGPIDAGAKALSDRIGYRLVVTNDARAAPIIVSVNKSDVRILDLFEALGIAAGSQATVIVDPDNRQVEVRYNV